MLVRLCGVCVQLRVCVCVAVQNVPSMHFSLQGSAVFLVFKTSVVIMQRKCVKMFPVALFFSVQTVEKHGHICTSTQEFLFVLSDL